MKHSCCRNLILIITNCRLNLPRSDALVGRVIKFTFDLRYPSRIGFFPGCVDSNATQRRCEEIFSDVRLGKEQPSFGYSYHSSDHTGKHSRFCSRTYPCVYFISTIIATATCRRQLVLCYTY